MKVFVTGVAGQLGYDVINELKKVGHIAIGSDIKNEDEIVNKANWDEYIKLDISDMSQVKYIETLNPDVIIHCAAWTNVDGAELEENKQLVRNINVLGTENLVNIAAKIDCKFLYISTDYVFNGEGSEPWSPEDKNFFPQNFYGQTKLLGEQAVSSKLKKYFIVRIAWVFGFNGKNFIKTMINVGRKNSVVKVVNDQIGTPTYTSDLSELLISMIESNKYGYYHATNEGGYISWYDLTCEIYKQLGMDVTVIPVTTKEYGLSIAKRPYNSRLDKSKLLEQGFKLLPEWKDALNRYLKQIGEIK